MPPVLERLNPILVRELRSSLRSQQFRVVFALALGAALVNALGQLLANDGGASSSAAQEIFSRLGLVLLIACAGLVPFWAFGALASEWDEGTYDLLELSSLRPRHVVLGKLASASVHLGLFFASFSPFVWLCFLLRGLGLVQIAVALAGILVAGLASTAVALALASFARVRILRYFLQAALALLLFGGGGLWAMVGTETVLDAGTLAQPDTWKALSALAVGLGLLASISLSIACARLAHPEENRSTPLRVAGASTTLVLLALGSWIAWDVGEPVVLCVCALFACGLLGLFGSLFASERPALGRRTRGQVPRGRLRAVLSAPWLPGGGRGLAWLGLGLLAVCGVAAVGPSMLDRSAPGPLAIVRESCGVIAASLLDDWSHAPNVLAELASRPESSHAGRGYVEPVVSWLAVLYGAAYVWSVVGLCSFLTTRWSTSPRLRVAAAALPVLAGLAAAILPSVLAFTLDSGARDSFDHPGNPFWVLVVLLDRHAEAFRFESGALWTIAGTCLVALLVLLLNARRLWRAFTEAEAAARERSRRAQPSSTPLSEELPRAAP